MKLKASTFEKVKKDFLVFFDKENLPYYLYSTLMSVWINAFMHYGETMKAKKPAKKPTKKPAKKAVVKKK